jgi:3-hydroxyisobutyrate dehydrogenase-like beta-hydroxyacid dehydrogenase
VSVLAFWLFKAKREKAMEKNIGFIGLGVMGEPMALNLMSGGFRLTVFNRTKTKTAGLGAAGASVATTPLEVGKKNEAVFLMLTGPQAINDLLLGEKGLLGEGSRCKTVVNMSTVSPAYTRDLAQRLSSRSVTLIDAPVSGSKKPAEEGSLVILASGPVDRVKELEPAFLRMGKKVVYCGEAGKASSMKMVVNLLLCTMIGGLSESLTLGEKCGLATEAILETVLAGPLGCGLFSMKAEMFKTGDYLVQFPFKHMFKDLNFILETARETGSSLKLGETMRDLYAVGMEQGLAELDFAAIKKVLASLPGH